MPETFRDFAPFASRLRAAVALPPRFWLMTVGTTVSILALRFGLDTTDEFANDVSGISAYITAIGVLYGILAALTIYVVWTQFNDAQEATSTEVTELLDLFRFAVYLRDQQALDRLRLAIIAYGNAVADDEWAAIAVGGRSPVAVPKLEDVFQAVNAVQFDDERDAHAWSEMIRKFEAVSDARSKRLELSAANVPSLLRGLLYLVSLALVIGFFMLSIRNDFLAIAVTAGTTAIVLLTIEVVEDLDDPFGGHWALSPDAFGGLADKLNAIAQHSVKAGG